MEPARARPDGKAEVREERVFLLQQGWPAELALAADTPGEYTAYVSHLGVVHFTSAAFTGVGWVKLRGVQTSEFPAGLPDGLTARIERIEWVAETFPSTS
ncbi:MAG: hypothetical protein K8U57_31360 [Planctomycetes bacterium]|nr:hypothetical protein [Planctomycetota bacterium]